MKLLMINESPLQQVGGDYYAIDPWIRFPVILAEHCPHLTLWSPIQVRDPAIGPAPGSWRLERGHLRIEAHDNYHTFVQYYRRYPLRYRYWKAHAEQLIDTHDVVILRHPSPMLPLIARAARRQQKPFVVMLVGDIARQSDRILGSRGWKRRFYQTLVKWWIRQEVRWCRTADLLYAYSRELMERHQVSVKVIKPMRTPHLRQSDIVAREDTCRGTTIRLIRVCWLIPSKGIEHLFDAVALLVRNGYNIQLQVIGRERIEGYRAQLQVCAAKLGLADRVTFSGWMPFDQLRAAYLSSDIQVISSLAEGTPRVLLEGAACGIPLVATAVGGSTDHLRDGEDALLVPPGDGVAIAAAVERLIHDGPLRRKLIHGGYAAAKAAVFETIGVQFLEDIKGLIPVSSNGESGWRIAAFERLRTSLRRGERPEEDARSADWKYLLPLQRTDHILVLGCGWGTVAANLAKDCGHVTAVDRDPMRIGHLNARIAEDGLSNITAQCLPKGASWSLQTERYDGVVLHDTWDATCARSTGAFRCCLQQAHDALKEGGWIWCCGRQRFGRRPHKLLRAAGFEAVEQYAPLPRHEGIPMFYLPLDHRQPIEFFFRNIFPLFEMVSPEVKRTYAKQYVLAKCAARIARMLRLGFAIRWFVPGLCCMAKKGATV